MIVWTTRLFPLWALALSAAGLLAPQPFAAAKPAIVPLLAVIMLGMGLSLTWREFRAVVRMPGTVAVGVLLQFGIMPLAAFASGSALDLPPPLLAGVVLVGTSSGGTASNVICYLAGGNLALSVTLTLASTLAAIALMPGLTWIYLRETVPVPAGSMLLSMIQIVALPVLAGTAINSAFRRNLDRVRPLFPLVSVGAIAAIIGIVAALNRERILEGDLRVALAVILHNAVGLFLGYRVARGLRFDRRTCRTLAIEVGMQNSGLSVALAMQYFTAAAALPGALFSLWHNLSGSVLAAIWGGRKGNGE